MIAGHFFRWQPVNLDDLFCEDTAVKFCDKLLLIELIPVGVAHAE